MLRTLLFSLTLSALAAMATAQNLVPNPSFEDTTNCQLPQGQFEYMLGLARPWFSPNLATPDVYTSNVDVACGVDIGQEGLIHAFDGLRYAGIHMYANSPDDGASKDYLAIRLNQSLIAGHTYRVSAHVALAFFARFSVDTFGIHFATDSLYLGAFSRIPVTPQVLFGAEGHFSSMEWVEVVGHYSALGGERYLYMGSFEEDSDMDCAYDFFFGGNDQAYYMIDQIEVRLADVGIVDANIPDTPAYVHQGDLYWSGHRSVMLAIYDAAGRQVFHSTGQRNIEGGLALPGDIANGLYLVRVSDAAGHAVLKWVKD